jgi:succinate dehydrogenase / fumarate reductase flavoprotein subunit
MVPTWTSTIKLAMQRHCALFPDGPLLEEGRGKLDGIVLMMRGISKVADRSMIFNSDLAETRTRQHAGPGERRPAFRDRA